LYRYSTALSDAQKAEVLRLINQDYLPARLAGLALWVGTFHVILQSKHHLTTPSTTLSM
jgi:hypothetical protein